MSKTVDSIMEDMENRVRENQPVSPAMWVDAAIKLNALKGDLDNHIADYEASIMNLEVQYMEDGKSSAAAKTYARGDNNLDYDLYLQAKAKSARIIEFIRLAKKRATIEEFSL